MYYFDKSFSIIILKGFRLISRTKKDEEGAQNKKSNTCNKKRVTLHVQGNNLRWLSIYRTAGKILPETYMHGRVCC